jgi:hypothetical protein
MSGNIISKDDNGYDKLAGIISEKMEENKWNKIYLRRFLS